MSHRTSRAGGVSPGQTWRRVEISGVMSYIISSLCAFGVLCGKSGSGHRPFLVDEFLPQTVLPNLGDCVDGGVQLRVERVEVRREADAGTGAVVADDVAGLQRLRDLIPMR